jgi:hypothetical protein
VSDLQRSDRPVRNSIVRIRRAPAEHLTVSSISGKMSLTSSAFSIKIRLGSLLSGAERNANALTAGMIVVPSTSADPIFFPISSTNPD